MKKQIKKPKLMCPIRDWASLDACKEYADEVYFSTSDLSLRQNSNNITLRELPRFVEECHKHKTKAFLVLNSVIYNRDINKAEKILKKAKEARVDSVIIWDPAVIELAKKIRVPFTISTQANISNWKTAEFYKKLGAKRVVLAREMTLAQIKEIIKRVKGLEFETFIHGAMCFSISGRCLLSAAIYNRSANCGACAQPCRKEWTLTDEEGHKITNKGNFFMSAQDLCMVEYIPELIEAGIDSFKIEGRRRDPHYIETTARIYREAIDAYFSSVIASEAKQFRHPSSRHFDRSEEGICDERSGEISHLHSSVIASPAVPFVALYPERRRVLRAWQSRAKKWKSELKKVYNRGFSTGFYFGHPSKEGISFDIADNQSPYRKILVGKVVHFYPKLQVALIRLNHKGIKQGDELYFESKKVYLRQLANSIEIENSSIKQAKKGQDVGIKVKKPIPRGTDVFMYKKNV